MSDYVTESDLKERKNPKILLAIILSPILLFILLVVYYDKVVVTENDVMRVDNNLLDSIRTQASGRQENIVFVTRSGIEWMYNSNDVKYDEIKDKISNKFSEIHFGGIVRPVSLMRRTKTYSIVSLSIDGKDVLKIDDTNSGVKFHKMVCAGFIVAILMGILYLIKLYFYSSIPTRDQVVIMDSLIPK